MELTRTQLFIKKCAKRLTNGCDFFNRDTQLMKASRFNTSKIKVLIIFPSSSDVKSVSATKEVINDYFLTECPNYFVDFAYLPNKDEIKIYDEYSVPYAIGNITHLDASFFDFVGFSISVLCEVLATPLIIKSFQRCNKPIPLTWSERKDEKIGSYPIFMAGGITSSMGDIMFGHLPDGRQAFLDFLFLGDLERLDKSVFERYLEYEGKGSIQGYIETLFDSRHIYQPQAYEVKFEDCNVISNIKVNEKAQDWVQPYYPYVESHRLSVARGIPNANGDSAGRAQVQLASGCSNGGCCNFCMESFFEGGWREVPIDIVTRNALEAKKYSAADTVKPYCFNAVPEDTYIPIEGGRFSQISGLDKWNRVVSYNGFSSYKEVVKSRHQCLRFRLKRGVNAVMSKDHRQVVLTENGLEVKLAKEIKVGDFIPSRIGYNEPVKADIDSKFYYLGLWFGDGSSGSRNHKQWDFNRQMLNVNETDLVEHCKQSEGVFSAKNENVRDNTVGFQYERWFCDFTHEVFPNYKYGPNRLYLFDYSKLISFVRGWYDADGDVTINKSGKSCRIKLGFATKSLGVFRLVGLVLNSIGIEFILSKKIKTVLNGKDFYRYDVTIVGLDSIRLFRDYIGFTQKPKQDKIIFNEGRSRGVTLPEVFGLWVNSYGDFPGRNITKFLNGRRKMLLWRFMRDAGDLDIEPVRLLKQGLRFSEVLSVSEEENEVDCIDVMETDNGVYQTEFGITHNCNYYSDYTELLYKLLEIYPRCSFINMRLDELGRDPDSITMMKLTGSNRMSAPTEGISERLRNGFLNKNLSQEALEEFTKYLISLKMTDVKVGIIFTGQEKDEDWQWMYDFVKKWKQYAHENGRMLPWRLKATPLVCYPLTPLYYTERIVAKRSYDNIKHVPNEWYEKYKEIGLGVKTNGFRYSTFIEQSIVDLGRLITPWLYRQVLMRDQMVWSLRQVADDESVRDLKSYITPGFFKAKDPDNTIPPTHRIRLQLNGSLLFASRRIYRGEYDSIERCLYTYNGAHTTCRKNSMKDEPYQLYGDVWIKDGKLNGVKDEQPDLLGCTYCQNAEMQKNRLKRNLTRKYTSDDIRRMRQLTPVQRLRFSVLRKPAFSLLSPNNTSHTSIAKLLDLSEVLLKSFHSVNLHNHFWQSEPFLPYDVAGRQMIDVLFTEKLDLDYIRSVIDQANQVLETVQIQSVSEPTREDKLSPEDLNIYTFKADLPNEEFTFARVGYKGEVRFMRDDFGTATYEVLTDKDLEAPVTVYKDGTVKGAFILKAKYNPYLFIQSVLKDKKHNLNELRERVSFTCIGTARLSQRVCKCGRDRILYSLNTDSELGLCSHCLPSLLLK